MTDNFRTPPPSESIPEGMANLVRVWQEAALAASHIAASRRTIYLAYLGEGFTEAQSLELIKNL